MTSTESIRKKFDPQLYADNDSAARTAVLRYLDRTSLGGWSPNIDKYGVDLVMFLPGNRIGAGVEVEVKRVWSGPDFPWDTLQIPERKLKFDKLEYPVEFWILNNELTHALVIPSRTISGIEPVVVRNKYVREGERFHQVPIDRCNWIELQVGSMNHEQ